MYGLIGRMLAVPGRRDALAAMMAEGMTDMPGCKSYVIGCDKDNDDAIWITEVWDSAARHKASLQLPQVQQLIGRARPLIAGMDGRTEMDVVGGIGLSNRP